MTDMPNAPKLGPLNRLMLAHPTLTVVLTSVIVGIVFLIAFPPLIWLLEATFRPWFRYWLR